MNFSQLQCFMVVATNLSFTKAADQLYKTQSVISRQIKGLEDELGIILFERGTRGVKLTKAGEVVFEGTKRIFSDYDDMRKNARAVQGGLDGEISLSVPASQVLDDTIMSIITGFKHEHPNINIRLRADNPEAQSSLILSGHVDFLYSRSGQYENIKNIGNLHVSTFENCLIYPKSMNKKNGEKMTIKDFKDSKFIVLPDVEGESHRKSVENIAVRHGIEAVCYTAENLGSMGLLVELGVGVSFVNCMNTILQNPKMDFLFMDDYPSTRYSVIWNEDYLTPSGSVFVGYVKKYLKQNSVQILRLPKKE